jgi:3-deoxy-D-manno-octulosonic acid kinase
MAQQTLISKRRFILYDEALLSHASATLFSPNHLRRLQDLNQAGDGRGKTWIVEGQEGDWVLRHYHRGGLVARINPDVYVWTGLANTRAWREWHLLDSLYKDGFPVPRPVAAQVERRGLWYRGDLITQLIPGTRSLASALRASAIEMLPWGSIGACIRRFHDASVYHADLNAHNILLDADDRVYLLDFDRGERRASGVLWKEITLKRLRRSLYKLADAALVQGHIWPRLLDAYNNKAA